MLNIDRSHTDVVIEILQLRVNTILLHVYLTPEKISECFINILFESKYTEQQKKRPVNIPVFLSDLK